MSKVAKGPQIILSRASIDFLTKLFEQEVPEMYEKIVSIESAAREPGGRSKIAVVSRDSDVDSHRHTDGNADRNVDADAHANPDTIADAF